MRKITYLSGVALRAGVPLVAWLVIGCSGPANDRFAATTNDEYPNGEIQNLLTAPNGPIEPGAPAPPPGSDGGIIDGGSPDGGGGPTGVPSGAWNFDDCSPDSPFLLDNTGHGATAQHAKKSSCVPGIRGQGIAFHSHKDIVQIADEPQFTVSNRIAVAAWVDPTTVTGHHPIILKRLGNDTSFSLGVHEGNAEFQVVLANGKTARARFPVDPNVWTHIGGVYDGQFLFLVVNGQQVGQVFAKGPLANVNAPVRIGATSQTQYFDGIIDEVWLSTNPTTVTDIAALSCIKKPATFSVSASASGPIPVGTTVHYALSLTDNDIGFCQPQSYFLQIPSFVGGGVADAGTSTGGDNGGPIFTDAGAPPPPPPGDGGTTGFDDSGGGPSDASPPPPPPDPNAGINVFANPNFVQNIPPGSSALFDVSVTGTDDATPGVHDIPFAAFTFNFFDPPVTGSLSFELAEPTGCHVSTGRELAIRDLSVVDDPIRTAPGGVWTFGRLMRDMAKTPADAAQFAERLFNTWRTDQVVNGFTVPARPAIQNILFANWPRLSDGSLDLDRAPLRLLAIVNRTDLRDLSHGDAGEGRFVFGVLGPGNNPEQFTVIVEYKLPAATTSDVLGWANAWHDLASHPFPSAEYNAALEALTLRFSGRDAAPGRPNGNALSQLRTNDFSLLQRWELRQFAISASTGFLEPQGVSLTPDLSLNGSSRLARFINQNQAAIIAEQFTVPDQFEGSPFLGGDVFNDLVTWNAPGIQNNEARFHFTLNTCNGCHGPDTNTTFLQISPRFPGQQASLSPFMTGTSAFDPVSGQVRQLNDLARRNADLKSLVCPAPPQATGATAHTVKPTSTPLVTTTIAKGISRVH
jgi:hypothetical protein